LHPATAVSLSNYLDVFLASRILGVCEISGEYTHFGNEAIDFSNSSSHTLSLYSQLQQR